MNNVVSAFRMLTLLLLAGVGLQLSHAQLPEENSPEGKAISNIAVKFIGAATVDENRILNNMTLRKGQAFSLEAQQKDTINLRERRIVEFVDIVPEIRGNTVLVTVTAMATGVLSEVLFEGATRFDRRELLKEVKAEVAQPLDEEKLLEGKFNIEELYRDKGYNEASVSYRMEADPETGYSRVIYGIVEGESNRLRKIFFFGNTLLSSKELRKLMKTKQRGVWSRITGSNKIDSFLLDEDKDTISRQLQDLGHMDARVTRHELRRVEEGSEFVDVLLYISEGLEYTVSDVRIGGTQKFSNADLATEVKMKGGDPFSATAIQADAQRLEDFYGRQGYADARVNTRIDSVGGQEVRISHFLREGEISYIRKINISGMEYTKDEVIRRELLVKPGEVFNTVKLRQSKQALDNTRYFSDQGEWRTGVDISHEDTGIPGQKDINVNLAEGKTGQFQVGAAFTSVENVFGYLSFSESNFDIMDWSRFPPRGDGQKFQFNLRWGTRTKDFLLGFTEPWFLGKRLSLGGEIYWREQLYLSSEYSQRMAGGAVWLRRPISRNTRLQLEYRLQEVQIFDLDSNSLVDRDGDGLRETFVRGVSPEIAQEEGTFLESKFTLELLQDTRDSNLLPRTGHRMSLSASLSGGFLGGEVDTYNLSAAFTQHVSLPWDTIFTFHGEANIADTWSDSDRVPIFNRHFLGGAYNLRGFDFRDIGPADEDEEALGGNTSAFVSGEYSFPIMERLRGSVFGDAGIVNSDAYDFSTADFSADLGMGIRLEVPSFGPMRLDYAFPVVKDERHGSSGRLNFLLDKKF